MSAKLTRYLRRSDPIPCGGNASRRDALAASTLGEPVMLHAAGFENATGVRLVVTGVPRARLHQDTLQGIRQQKHDVPTSGSVGIADVQPGLQPLPEGVLAPADCRDGLLLHHRGACIDDLIMPCGRRLAESEARAEGAPA